MVTTWLPWLQYLRLHTTTYKGRTPQNGWLRGSRETGTVEKWTRKPFSKASHWNKKRNSFPGAFLANFPSILLT